MLAVHTWFIGSSISGSSVRDLSKVATGATICFFSLEQACTTWVDNSTILYVTSQKERAILTRLIGWLRFIGGVVWTEVNLIEGLLCKKFAECNTLNRRYDYFLFRK